MATFEKKTLKVHLVGAEDCCPLVPVPGGEELWKGDVRVHLLVRQLHDGHPRLWTRPVRLLVISLNTETFSRGVPCNSNLSITKNSSLLYPIRHLRQNATGKHRLNTDMKIRGLDSHWKQTFQSILTQANFKTPSQFRPESWDVQYVL